MQLRRSVKHRRPKVRLLLLGVRLHLCDCIVCIAYLYGIAFMWIPLLPHVNVAFQQFFCIAFQIFYCIFHIALYLATPTFQCIALHPHQIALQYILDTLHCIASTWQQLLGPVVASCLVGAHARFVLQSAAYHSIRFNLIS